MRNFENLTRESLLANASRICDSCLRLHNVMKKPLLGGRDFIFLEYTGTSLCGTKSAYFALLLFLVSLILIYLLTAIRLTLGGSSTVHIYTQTVHRTTH